MATLIWRDVSLYVAELDLSGHFNEASLALGAEMQDETVFKQDTRRMKAGLLTNSMAHRGFWDASDGASSPDAEFFGNIGLEDVITTILPEGSDQGDIAYQALMAWASYSPGAAVGELLEFDVEAAGRQAATRSEVLLDPVQRLASGQSTKQQLGAVAAGQSVYGALHLIQFDGTSLDVVVRSDADSGAGGETTRLTFNQSTGLDSQQQIAAGPITDTWWDVDFTLVGTSFTALVVVGIR